MTERSLISEKPISKCIKNLKINTRKNTKLNFIVTKFLMGEIEIFCELKTFRLIDFFEITASD